MFSLNRTRDKFLGFFWISLVEGFNHTSFMYRSFRRTYCMRLKKGFLLLMQRRLIFLDEVLALFSSSYLYSRCAGDCFFFEPFCFYSYLRSFCFDLSFILSSIFCILSCVLLSFCFLSYLLSFFPSLFLLSAFCFFLTCYL